MSITFGAHIAENSIEPPHLLYRTAGNPYVPANYDCALRAFTIEMAVYIAPPPFKSNWTTLSQSAYQMNQCNGTLSTTRQNPTSAKTFKTAPEIPKGACEQAVFVHDLQGSDLFDGTFDRPLKTIQAALSHTRTLRAVHGSDKTLCITIRGGTYYLGTNATPSSSQIGAIALTSNDSNLVIENYQDERLVLSGGTLLQLQWSVHAKTTAGGTIMKAQVPSYVNLDQFNELYIDERRAIVAKYPNGDPSTQGLYAQNPGFSYDSESWVPPTLMAGVNINVLQPNRSGTQYPNYRLSIGGGASVFNPPRSFWGTTHAVPLGVVVKNGALPHQSNWSKPTTGFVHAFHGGYWGSWVFEIASSNNTQNTIMFRRARFTQ